MIYLEKTDSAATLTTWVYCFMWMQWSAEQQGINDIYINMPGNYKPDRCLRDLKDVDKFSQEPNQWNWYFKQPRVWAGMADEIWTWETWVDKTPVPFMSQPLSVIKDYYKKNLHFSDAVNQRGEALVTKYKIDFKNTIGITWRGTDIYLDGRPRIPIQTYFPFIDEILKDNPGLRIMCTAEEETILDPLLARYPNAFKIYEFLSSPYLYKHNPERFSPVSGFERGMQPALMVWLFSKCAHYIKNRSSTGAVASWLSNGRIVSLGHPENLGFPANTNTAEIEGKLYPL